MTVSEQLTRGDSRQDIEHRVRCIRCFHVRLSGCAHRLCILLAQSRMVELCHFAATRSHISDWPRPQKAVLPHHRGPASSSQRRSGPLAMSIYRASPLAFRAYQLVAIDVAARTRPLTNGPRHCANRDHSINAVSTTDNPDAISEVRTRAQAPEPSQKRLE